MSKLIPRALKKYSEFILKIITFIGLLLTYVIGISIGFLIFKFKKNNQKKSWYRFNQNFNPKDMY